MKSYKIDPDSVLDFRNNVAFCVGTGRLGLALHREYFEQLKLVQEQIGFRYIRGHGLFNEDLAICQRRPDGTIEYNFTYLDRITDGYLELNIRPFLELGFMPKVLASGEQEVFYWKGNVTPPRDYAEWNALVGATLRHLVARYGAEEVTNWPVEVWNEPNLGGFWENADRKEYFKLFKETIFAVKTVDERFRVGGPAICGVDDESWLRDFLDFCRDERLPLDFITRHLYTIEFPEQSGRYGYPKLRPLENATDETKGSRKIIDEYDEFRGMEMHVTEFNTSYSPITPLHDTNLNAAYLAFMLSKLGDESASYSYWTFGDVFEEQGVPFTPFHGGFGLVANGCIPKPAFYTFKFFKNLVGGECVLREDDCVVVRCGDVYKAVMWNLDGEDKGITLELPDGVSSREYSMTIETVDENSCNPLQIWHHMGEPASLSKRQLELLRQHAVPDVTAGLILKARAIGIELKPNAVKYVEFTPATLTPDWGFDYGRAQRA
ncbi:MAG: xylan 1,4-beta-xylosidase [Oscillospiraceae bacterium]|jgi:xylan 1,4-beta-xylosidase|nr:xylan 1,4-beta-xylosidase [Oscillospiraceae bacterium]